MIDMLKRLVRYVVGDEEAMHESRSAFLTSGICEPWQKDPASKPNWDNHNGQHDQSERRQRSADGLHHSIPREQQSEESKNAQTRVAGELVSLFDKGRGNYQDDELAEQDRHRMPPPPSRRHAPSVRRFKRQSTVAGSQFDSETDARTMVTNGSLASKLGGLFEAEQEKRALQHAEAFRIHPDSGFWYQSEAGLYEHLWIRGREPLLPLAWAPDFNTYPTTLFNLDPDDMPLITNIYSPQFHAIHSLRELVEMGHKVRDQLQAGLKLVRIQRTIQKGIEAYVEWALNDANLYADAGTIPVHHIGRRHPKQTTVKAISALAERMCGLLTEHRQAFHTTPHPAIRSPSPQDRRSESASSSAMPPPSPTKDSGAEPQILDDSQGHLPPVVIGFLVVGPTATIFTLNARNADAAVTGDLARGIHMLGRFNFTESRFDVWNALALALAACHLRTALLAVAKPASRDNETRFLHGTLAGYLSREEFEATKKRKREEAEQDDPDPKGKGKAKATTDGAKRRKPTALDDSDPDR